MNFLWKLFKKQVSPASENQMQQEKFRITTENFPWTTTPTTKCGFVLCILTLGRQKTEL